MIVAMSSLKVSKRLSLCVLCLQNLCRVRRRSRPGWRLTRCLHRQVAQALAFLEHGLPGARAMRSFDSRRARGHSASAAASRLDAIRRL